MSRLIYLLEDNPTDAAVLCHWFEHMDGVRLEVFGDGLEGLNACLKTPPDALFLDLQLPSLSGEEVCRLLRASPKHRHIPIVIVSDLPDAKRQEMDMLMIGADFYLSKPFSKEKLMDIVERTFHKVVDRQKVHIPEPVNLHSVKFVSDALEKLTDESTNAPTKTPNDSMNVRAFDGYEIIDIIGAGGMGTVYKAEQKSLRRIVALKVIKESLMRNRRSVERFEREARIMARLSHPNIVQVYDVGRTDYYCYFAMEYVSGHSLYDIVRVGNLDWEGIIRVIAQSCEAISYLHDNGIVHRDIKPSNILFSKHQFIKVTDFGISTASFSDDAEDEEHGAEIGTTSFMAPEQPLNRTASPLSDQYSLALTFWQIFTGQNIKQGTPLPIHQVRQEFPVAISQTIQRALHPDPAMRYPSVRDLKRELIRSIRDYAQV